jgi:hypothetical protein
MALTHKDFLLTDSELDEINRHFAQRVKEYVQAGEDPASGVKVEFEWVPGLGRFVTANFDSAVNGLDISGFTPKRTSKT